MEAWETAPPVEVPNLEKMQSYPSGPTAVQVPIASVQFWRIFTDGAGPQAAMAKYAGWGAAIWDNSSESNTPTFELYGPVCIHSGDARWLGADTHTNNAGELTSMVEALLWLEKEAPGPIATHRQSYIMTPRMLFTQSQVLPLRR